MTCNIQLKICQGQKYWTAMELAGSAAQMPNFDEEHVKLSNGQGQGVAHSAASDHVLNTDATLAGNLTTQKSLPSRRQCINIGLHIMVASSQ